MGKKLSDWDVNPNVKQPWEKGYRGPYKWKKHTYRRKRPWYRRFKW